MTLSVVLADANILYSRTLRDYFLYAADAGAIELHWSQEILDEMSRNLRAGLGIDTEHTDRLEQLMNAYLEYALVEISDEATNEVPEHRPHHGRLSHGHSDLGLPRLLRHRGAGKERAVHSVRGNLTAAIRARRDGSAVSPRTWGGLSEQDADNPPQVRRATVGRPDRTTSWNSRTSLSAADSLHR